MAEWSACRKRNPARLLSYAAQLNFVLVAVGEVMVQQQVTKKHQMILLSVHYISSTFLSNLAGPSNYYYCSYF